MTIRSRRIRISRRTRRPPFRGTRWCQRTRDWRPLVSSFGAVRWSFSWHRAWRCFIAVFPAIIVRCLWWCFAPWPWPWWRSSGFYLDLVLPSLKMAALSSAIFPWADSARKTESSEIDLDRLLYSQNHYGIWTLIIWVMKVVENRRKPVQT